MTLAFGGIVLLLIGRSIWSQDRLSRALARYDTQALAYDEAQGAVQAVSSLALDMETAVRGYELTRQESFLDPYRRAEPTLEPALTRLAALEIWSVEARAHAARTGELMREWLERVGRPLSEGRFEGARTSHVEARRLMDAIRAELGSLRAALTAGRDAERETFRELERDTQAESLYVGLALVLLVLVLATLSTRTIDRALSGLVGYAERAGHGKHEAAPDSSLVEIRALGTSLEALSARVAHRAARDKRLAELYASLAEAGSVASIADATLRYAEAITESIGGVLWLREDERLEARAASGISLRDLPVDAHALAAAAVASGTIESLELGEGARVVRSALLDVSPRRALAVPLGASGRTVGVIELLDPRLDPDDDLQRALTRVALSLEAVWASAAAEQLRTEVHASNQELQAQNEELRSQEEELRSQREALQASQTQLELRNEELSRATRAKSDFLASMSHELRTPLNAVLGFSDLLLEQADSRMTEEEKHFVADIHDAGEQLLRLVNDVLDLARVEAGALTVASEPMDAAKVAREAANMLGPVALRRGVRIELDGLDHALECVGDPGRVRQVVVNLLSNAIKFTRQNTVVGLSGRASGERVRIEVTDQGPGIAESDLARLFQPFSQLAHGKSTAGGAGLGLSIVKQLIEQMQGRVGVDTVLGRGATFFVELPIRASRASAPTTPLPSGAALPRGTALVVEDLPAEARSLDELLTRAGFVVQVVGSAEQALAVLPGIEPSLLVVDLGLPGMSGHAFIAELAARPATARVPKVALTARMLDERERERLLASGASLVAEKGVMTGPGFIDSVLALRAPAAAAHRGVRRVLVVDDVEINRRVLSEMLPKDRFAVTCLPSGVAALALLETESFDLVLMDVQMPELDGLETTRRIHARPSSASLPVIAVTAQAMVGDRDRALAAGCVGYLPKPVGRAELYAAVENALAAADERRS